MLSCYPDSIWSCGNNSLSTSDWPFGPGINFPIRTVRMAIPIAGGRISINDRFARVLRPIGDAGLRQFARLLARLPTRQFGLSGPL
jgi:hypothetical protein